MTTFNTGLPVPSADPRDRHDNSQTFDEVINGTLTYYVNRKGANVYSLAGMAALFNAAQGARANEFTATQGAKQAQFDAAQVQRQDVFNQFLEGSGWTSLGAYAAGLSIVSHSQTVDYLGQPYALKPSVPASLSSPYITTGNWGTEGGNFKLVGDNSLRQDLAGPGGSSFSGFERTLLSKRVSTAFDMLNAQTLNVWEKMPTGVTYSPTSDPATWPELSTALASAANALSSSGGGTLQVPQARYRLSSGFVCPANVMVEFNFSVIYFYGTGRAISVNAGTASGGGLARLWLEAKGTSQHGVYLQGTSPILHNAYIRNFDGISLRVGDLSVAGAQWASVRQVHVWNQWGTAGGVKGDIGILVDGSTVGLNPNANLNRFSEIMVSGGFNVAVDDRGVDNKWDGLNIAWRQAAGMTMFRASNSGATVTGFYVESADGTQADLGKVLVFTGTSSRVFVDEADFVFSPGVGRNLEAYVSDLGYNNDFRVKARGNDAGGSGRAYSPGMNLFGNGLFKVWQSSTTPRGGRGASATITKGPVGSNGGRSVQFNDVASNSSISFDITPSGSSLVNIPVEFLKGKTLTVGFRVKSNYPGPMVKIFAGSGNTASTGEHTGDGTEQFLAATLKVDAAATSVFIQLRSNNLGGGINTGTANFSGGVLVFGGEIPRDFFRSVPESGGVMAGDLEFLQDAVTFSDSAFPKLPGGRYLWFDTSGALRSSATRPTVQNSGDLV